MVERTAIETNPGPIAPLPCHKPDPTIELAKSILKLAEAVFELKAENQRAERLTLNRIEDKIDRLTKDFAKLQEDREKIQTLFNHVAEQQERIKKLSA